MGDDTISGTEGGNNTGDSSFSSSATVSNSKLRTPNGESFDDVFIKPEPGWIPPQSHEFKTPTNPSKKRRRLSIDDNQNSVGSIEDDMSDVSMSSAVSSVKRKKIRNRVSSATSVCSTIAYNSNHIGTDDLSRIYNDCISLYTKNGITVQNAFNLKLADVIDSLIRSKIFDKSDLTKAGHMLAASTKIFTCQVVNTHQHVLKLAAIIGRNKERVRELQLAEELNSDDDEPAEQPLNTTLQREIGRRQKRVLKKGKFVVEKDNLSQIANKFDNQSASYQVRREKLKEKFTTSIKENRDFDFNGEFMSLKAKENLDDNALLELPRALINYEDVSSIPFLPFRRAIDWDSEKHDIWGLEPGFEIQNYEVSGVSILPEPDPAVVFNEDLAHEAYNVPELDPTDSEFRENDGTSNGHSHLDDSAIQMNGSALVDIRNVSSLDQVVDYFNSHGASALGSWTGIFKEHHRERGHIVDKKERRRKLKQLDISLEKYNDLDLRFSIFDVSQEHALNSSPMKEKAVAEINKYFSHLIGPCLPTSALDDSMEVELEDPDEKVQVHGSIIGNIIFNSSEFENDPWAEDYKFFFSNDNCHIQRRVIAMEDSQEGFESHEGFIDEDLAEGENIRDNYFEANNSFVGLGKFNTGPDDWMGSQDPNGTLGGQVFSELMSKIQPPKNINMKDIVMKIYRLLQCRLKLDKDGEPTMDGEMQINITDLLSRLRNVLNETASKDMSFHIFVVALLHVLADHKLFLKEVLGEYFVVSKGRSFLHVKNLLFTSMPTITKE